MTKIEFEPWTLSNLALNILLEDTLAAGCPIGEQIYVQLLAESERRRNGLPGRVGLEFDIPSGYEVRDLVLRLRHRIILFETVAATIMRESSSRGEFESLAAFYFAIVNAIYRLACPGSVA